MSAMFAANPDYPRIVLSFTYRDWMIQLDRCTVDQREAFAVWVSSDRGYAVAVPYAFSRSEAIERAKRWIDDRTP